MLLATEDELTEKSESYKEVTDNDISEGGAVRSHTMSAKSVPTTRQYDGKMCPSKTLVESENISETSLNCSYNVDASKIVGFPGMQESCVGNSKEAQDLFREMQEKGFAADDFMFNIMVQGCLDQKNDTHKAMQLLNIMLDKGFSPDAKTSSLLVDLFVKGGPNCKEMEMLLKCLPKGCAKGAQEDVVDS